jgi:transcriptional regulator with XRE-family HTH domain
MVKFKQKKIVTANLLGEDLRRARLRHNLSLKAVEIKIGITEKYLEALENSDWEALPGEIYAKNWLKKYGLFLGLEADELKDRFETETASLKIWPSGLKDRFGSMQTRVTVWPLRFKKVLVLMAVVAIVAYLGGQLWQLIRPPYLEVIYPPQEMVIHGRLIKILGRADLHAAVKINGEKINLDPEGWFKVDMTLNKGLNVIEIEARKKYGPVKRIERKLIALD